MKGFFSFWSFFGITIWIDLITHFLIKAPRKSHPDAGATLSVMIPAHGEERYIESTVNWVYKEKYPIRSVIVCGDHYSPRTKSIIERMKLEHENLFYVECPKVSKAEKINYVARHFRYVGRFLYVRDSRVHGNYECIERMMASFSEKKVAAVTSYGRVSIPRSTLGRAYHYGKAWINEIGRFRKLAQEKRNAVFVVCGASTIYRTEVLRKIRVPAKTKTEDTHYSWLLQRRGYRIRVADDAVASAPDVDGRFLGGLVNQLRQSLRWSCGTLQCLVYESRFMKKNKKLFFSTIIPGVIESITYSVALLLLPLIMFLSPSFALGFFIGDTVFSLVGTLVLMPKKFLKTIIHYPQILFFKYCNSAIFLYSVLLVFTEVLLKDTSKWNNRWGPLSTGSA